MRTGQRSMHILREMPHGRCGAKNAFVSPAAELRQNCDGPYLPQYKRSRVKRTQLDLLFLHHVIIIRGV